jgi:hypothetical protein
MKLVRKLMMLMCLVMAGTHLPASAQQDSVKLEEPGPIALPGKFSYTTNEVRKAILTAAMRHDWRIESESPGVARIVLDGRTDRAVLVMDIIYDTNNYSIKYIRSDGLRYTPGNLNDKSTVVMPKGNYSTREYESGPAIHPSYARWMKNLTNSINVELLIVKI